MFDSSPGYALFTDLRKKMGATSSQPVQTPSRVAKASLSSATERKAHSNPDMDDVAASQQLMDEEGTRAAAPNGTNGEDITKSRQKKRKRKSGHKASKNSAAIPPVASQDMLAEADAPASSPFPFPATQPEATFPAINGFKHPTAIEVPDSQVPAQSAHARAPSPTSSYVVPSSATKSKRTYKKSNQTKRDRLSRDAMREEEQDHDRDISMLLEDALSPSHTPSKHKPSQVDDTESRAHRETDVAPVTETVGATPTPAKRRKIGSAKSATRVRDLIQDGLHAGDDEEGDLLWNVEKTKLKRIKKPQTPAVKTKNIYEIPDDDPHPANGHSEDIEATNGLAQPEDAAQVNTPKETSTRQPHGSLKKAKKTRDDVDDSATPDRTSSQPLGENKNEDSIMREPVSSDEDDYHGPPPDASDDSGTENKQRKKRKRSTKKPTPRRESAKFTYTRKKVPAGTAAERALEVDHDLNHPPDLQSTGDFTQDEEELIRRAIRDFQDRKNLDVSELVRIIQWSNRDPALNRTDEDVSGRKDWTPQDIDNARKSAEFWDDIKNMPAKRSLDRMRRHIRQTYHQFKSGAWTEDEDEELRKWYAMHPNKWKVIQHGMGDRSMHDCQNRWRDYLQYGDKLKSSRWEPEEEELFIRAITTVVQRDEDHRAESGVPPVDEYTTKHINWQQVSHEMDNTRSRIQVVAKWKNLQKRNPPPHIQVEHKPRKSRSALSGLTASDPTPRKRGRPRKGEGETPKGRHNGKSQEVVDESDQDGGHSALPLMERGRPRTGESSVVKESKKFRTVVTEGIADNSDEEEHANKEPNSPLSKKKRRESRKSEGAEVDKPKKSRSSKIRDDIENSDEEVRADLNTNTSPPLKKRGKLRKTDHVESDEAKQRHKSRVSQETVEDPELKDHDELEHAESNDKSMEDVQRPNNLPHHHPDGGDEQPRDMDENEDPIEDEEDLPRVEPQSPIAGLNGNQVEDGSDAVSQKDSDDVSDSPLAGFNDRQSEANSDAPSREGSHRLDKGDNPLGVTHNRPAEDINDDQSSDANDTAPQKPHSSPSVSEESQPSVTPNLPSSSKPTITDTTKMQWGDLYDLIAKLQERRDEEEGDIDWDGVAEEVAADRTYTWSPNTLQIALEEMIQLLKDNDKDVDTEDLPGTVDDIMDFISTEHGAEIEEYYTPE